MIGRTISHYKVTEKLGEGGMGVVYKAEDLNLGREVALKFLTREALGDEEYRKRFVREARAAASLNHPNICTVYGIHLDGEQPFLAMEFVDGEDVKRKIGRGPLKLENALGIAIQAGLGLQSAHERGIVHRDIKSANLMVTKQGHVKVADFGLALVEGWSRQTKQNQAPGTPGYMSPEQVLGETVDRRADIWALGVVLYEMVTGRLPFEGEYQQAVLYGVIHEKQAPLTALRSDVPIELDRIVAKALAKHPDQRYQHADDFLVDLRNATGTSSGSSVTRRPLVCVLPFRNRSRDEDDEYFADGVTEDVISTLGKVAGLRVVPRTSAFHFKGTQPHANEIVKALDVTHIVEGTVRRSGERLRVTVELVDATNGSQVWTERYDRIPDDIFDVQDEISAAIAGALETKLVPSKGTPAAGRRVDNFEAYRLYLKGRHAGHRFSGASLTEAVSHFEKALAVEPDYAPAHAGLAQAFCSLGSHGHIRPRDVIERARQNAQAALTLDETLAEAHIAMGFIQQWSDWRFDEAEASYRRAIELQPDDPVPRIWLGEMLAETKRAQEGIAELRTAVSLDPLSGVANRILCYGLLYSGDLAESAEQGRRALEIDPADTRARWYLSRALTMSGEIEAALEIANEMEKDPADPITIANVAMVRGAAGDRERALHAIEQLLDMRSSFYASPAAIAFAYSQLPDHDQTFHWFEIGLKERDGLLVTARQPCGDESFRNDPRYKNLLERVGLPV